MSKRAARDTEELNTDEENHPISAEILRPSLASFAFAGSDSSPRKRAKVGSDDNHVEQEHGSRLSTEVDGRRRSSRIKVNKLNTEVDLADTSEELLESKASVKSAVSKVKKAPKGYAPPEKYAHLRELQDVIDSDLDVLFCGINPGRKSAEIGHHFGHPSNQFWYCLHQAGFTSRQLSPTEEFELPGKFRLGITDLVDRPTSEESELSVQDKIDGIPTLLAKVHKYRPRILCFVSLDNARIVQVQMNKRYKASGVKPAKSGLGLQSYKMVHGTREELPEGAHETLFYAVPSTSGLVRVPQRDGKVEIFKGLRQLLNDQKSGTLDTSELRVISPG